MSRQQNLGAWKPHFYEHCNVTSQIASVFHSTRSFVVTSSLLELDFFFGGALIRHACRQRQGEKRL